MSAGRQSASAPTHEAYRTEVPQGSGTKDY